MIEQSALTQHFADQMSRLFPHDPPKVMGIAVSGGGDSMALMYLAAGWAKIFGVDLRVITIDHGLRDASAAEAVMVADAAKRLGLSHDIKRWTEWNGRGNISDAARRARRILIDQWRGEIDHILMAHTQTDQAETFLMRLRRGSGVDGLAAMAERQDVQGANGLWTIVRPLLNVDRETLRAYLRGLKVDWADDPTNEDATYERVRMRNLLPELARNGITPELLGETARRMARAQIPLRQATANLAQVAVTEDQGDLYLLMAPLIAADEETRFRLLSAAVMWVTTGNYRPRFSSLQNLWENIRNNKGVTLGGCSVHCVPGGVWLTRELAAVRGHRVRCGTLWDGRWQLNFDGSDMVVRALGQDGYAQINTPRNERLPMYRLVSKPAIFQGDTLIACKAAQFGPDHPYEFIASKFESFLLTR